MFRFAVSAVAEAPCVDGDDLHEGVAPNLGKVESREFGLAEESNNVSLECLLHDLHNAVDLLHANDRDAGQRLEIAVALRNTASDN